MAEKEYIAKEFVIDAIEELKTKPMPKSLLFDHLTKLIEIFPTEDFVPVRHVTNRAKYFGETLCPNCGIHLDETTIISKDENEDGDIIHYEFQPNFCANCGAKMDGDSNADKT